MDPRLQAEIISALCSLGPRPHIVTGFLRQWFISHFSKETQIEHPELRTKLWKRIPTETEIEIESVTRWKPQTTEFRPSIIIARNDWKVLRVGINDQMMGERWDFTGTDHFAAYLEGSHTLFCISNLAEEAEILGAEVYRELMQFGPKVREELDLKRFVVVGVGKLFEIEEARQNYAVPVTVAYGVEERWKLIPHAPFLKRVVFSAFLP
jgi:hypothetical protein